MECKRRKRNGKSEIAALGVPGLILLVAISGTGLAEAATTAALAALGPFGMLGGILTLGVISLAVGAIGEYGFEAIFKGILKELIKQGHTVAELKHQVKYKYKLLSKSLKCKLIGYLDEFENEVA